MNLIKLSFVIASLLNFFLASGNYNASNSDLYIQHSTLNACRPLVRGEDTFNVQVNDTVFSRYNLNKNDDYRAFIDDGLLATKAGDPLQISNYPLTT